MTPSGEEGRGGGRGGEEQIMRNCAPRFQKKKKKMKIRIILQKSV